MKDYKFKTQNIKGKEYVPVFERIKYLDANYRGKYSILQEERYMPELNCWFVKTRLIVEFSEGNTREFQGVATEVIGDSMVNKTSAIENSSTSSIGRALAAMGVGIDTSMASADEVENAIAQQETPKAPTPTKYDGKDTPNTQTYTKVSDTRKQQYHDLVVERVSPAKQSDGLSPWRE